MIPTWTVHAREACRCARRDPSGQAACLRESRGQDAVRAPSTPRSRGGLSLVQDVS